MPEVTIVWCEANHLLSIQNMAEQGFGDTCDAENASQKRNRTGKTCAVAECTGRNSDGISIHSFPSDPSLRRQWVKFVRVCRADFTIPTRNSVVCERHFAPECYPVTYRLMKQEGFVVRRKDLLPGSVPTIQKHAFSHPSRQLQHKTPTSCADSIVPTSPVTTVTSNSSHVVTSTVILQRTLARLYQLPGVIKPRGAYVKREHQRVVSDILSSQCDASTATVDTHAKDVQDVQHPVDAFSSVGDDSQSTSSDGDKGPLARKCRRLKKNPFPSVLCRLLSKKQQTRRRGLVKIPVNGTETEQMKFWLVKILKDKGPPFQIRDHQINCLTSVVAIPS